MLYVLIFIIVAIIVTKYKLRTNYIFRALLWGVSVGGLASTLLAYICLTAALLGIGGKDFSETYQLEKIAKNQYYQVNTEGNSVSVFVETDKNMKEKMTFSEDIVKFKLDTNEARVEIKGKKNKWHPLAHQIINYKEVIISFPEESEITKRPSGNETEEKKESSDESISYCPECGAKLQEGNKFCGECGVPLE